MPGVCSLVDQGLLQKGDTRLISDFSL